MVTASSNVSVPLKDRLEEKAPHTQTQQHPVAVVYVRALRKLRIILSAHKATSSDGAMERSPNGRMTNKSIIGQTQKTEYRRPYEELQLGCHF